MTACAKLWFRKSGNNGYATRLYYKIRLALELGENNWKEEKKERSVCKGTNNTALFPHFMDHPTCAKPHQPFFFVKLTKAHGLITPSMLHYILIEN
jgi:hypothetical protein